MLAKIVSSLLLGGSIGAGPYLMATQLPKPEIIKTTNETIGFGEICFLSQEMCDFMKLEEWQQDEEIVENIENPYVQGNIKSKLDSEWTEFIKEKPDDYCGYGFIGWENKDPQELIKESQKKINVNNLESCYKYLVEKLRRGG